MAKIVKKGMDLEKKLAQAQKQYSKKRDTALLFFGGAALTGIGIFFLRLFVFWYIPAILMGLCVLFLFSSASDAKEIDIVKVGIEGENATSNCIEWLPDSYTAFRNLTVQYDGKSSEIDLLLVGPTGLFVIETKNLNGYIRADLNGTQWTQHKVGRGGTPYSKTFYSPVKQVNTHVYRLANALKQRGVRAYVNPVVFFANEETTLEIMGRTDKAMLFSAQNNGVRQMMEYILRNPQTIPQNECDRIVRILQSM